MGVVEQVRNLERQILGRPYLADLERGLIGATTNSGAGEVFWHAIMTGERSFQDALIPDSVKKRSVTESLASAVARVTTERQIEGKLRTPLTVLDPQCWFDLYHHDIEPEIRLLALDETGHIPPTIQLGLVRGDKLVDDEAVWSRMRLRPEVKRLAFITFPQASHDLLGSITFHSPQLRSA